MKALLFILPLITIHLTTINSQQLSNSEFCKKCNCTEKTVTCQDIKIGSNISSLAYWQDVSNNNTQYEFVKISVQNGGIIHVMPFPASPIKTLDLSRNKIEILEKGCFKDMQNLTEIDLSYNDITSELLIPDVFEGIYAEDEYLPLKSLRILRLGYNQLHTLHQDIFEHIVNLEILDLRGNALRVIDTQTLIAISGLRYLRRLDLSYTFIKKLPDGLLHTPKNLTELVLTGNGFTSIPPQLSDAVNLRYLCLNENPITNITKENGFPVLSKLQILHLCYLDNLTRIENGALSGLQGLKELHISENKALTFIGNNTLGYNDSGTEIWPLITKFDKFQLAGDLENYCYIKQSNRKKVLFNSTLTDTF